MCVFAPNLVKDQKISFSFTMEKGGVEATRKEKKPCYFGQAHQKSQREKRKGNERPNLPKDV